MSATFVLSNLKEGFIVDFHTHSHPLEAGVSLFETAKPSSYDLDFAYKAFEIAKKHVHKENFNIKFNIRVAGASDYENSYGPRK